MANDELPSKTLIDFYGLEDPDAGPEAKKAARKLRRDEVKAAEMLRTLMAERGGRPLDDTDMTKAQHRESFLRGVADGKRREQAARARLN